MPCYCRLQNGICCKEGQGGADNQRKQPPRVKHHKDMFRNEDRDINEGINKVRRRRKPMLKEHLNELKSRKRAQLRLPLFPWGWDIETEAGEVQRVGAVIRKLWGTTFLSLSWHRRGRHCHRRWHLQSKSRKTISKYDAA